MKRMLWLGLFLPLFLSACGKEKGTGAYGVYYAVQGERSAVSAVECEYHTLPEGSDPLTELTRLVMSQPRGSGLASPLAGAGEVYLRSVSLKENGHVVVDLSEQYGGLSGIDLTRANACFALTLCQLEQVKSVSVIVEGKPISYQALQVLREGDLLLTGGESRYSREEP